MLFHQRIFLRLGMAIGIARLLVGCGVEVGPEEDQEEARAAQSDPINHCGNHRCEPQLGEDCASCRQDCCSTCRVNLPAGDGPFLSLPAFSTLWTNYLQDDDSTTPPMNSSQVNTLLFGKKLYDNTCAIRVSDAFNKSGAPIPKTYDFLPIVGWGFKTTLSSGTVGTRESANRLYTEAGKTAQGQLTGSYYAIRAAELARYLWDTYGAPSREMAGSPNRQCFSDAKGILIVLYRRLGSFGHIDLWDGTKDRCALGAVGPYTKPADAAKSCYFDDASVYYTALWKMP
jgi:hypothetical protein